MAYENIWEAIRYSDLEAVKLFIDGLDVDAKNSYGYTLIQEACLYKSKKIVKLLIKKGADIRLTNNFGETPLHIASKYGLKGIVKLLLKKDVSLYYVKNNMGDLPFHLARAEGHNKILKMLENAKAEINKGY